MAVWCSSKAFETDSALLLFFFIFGVRMLSIVLCETMPNRVPHTTTMGKALIQELLTIVSFPLCQ